MSKLCKDIAAYLMLAAYLAVPVVLWQASVGSTAWADSASVLRSIGQVSGLLGASMFSLNFVLAARLRWLEDLMSGLPRVYVVHHIFGGLTLILLLTHPLFLGLQYLSSSLSFAANFFVPSLSDIPKLLGVLALGTLAVLLFITFFIRIAYHKWKSTHQWLGLSLLFASLHVYLIPGHLSSAPELRVYMVLIIVLGLVAFAYRVLFGRWLVRRSPYKVQSVNVHDDNGTEVTLAPIKKPVNYQAGQFLFVRVHDSAGITREPHPFSFTSPPAAANISFTAKPLGDYTKTLKSLMTGSTVDIEGPYGRFIFANGGDSQVWVAGGIGITPFMSRVRELEVSGSEKITLYYAVRDKKDALFADELRTTANKIDGFTLRLWESNTEGKFAVRDIAELKAGADHTYFICGPPQMLVSMKQDLKKVGVKRGAVYAEEFKLY